MRLPCDGDLADGFGQGFALDGKHPFLKSFRGIVGCYLARSLEYDRTMIVLIVDEMNGAARLLDTMFQYRGVYSKPIHAVSTERGDQRRMDIENAILKVFGNEHMLEITSHDD